MRRLICSLAGLLALSAFEGRGEVALNPLFGDHMVLQRDRPLPIWGTATPGETVTVTFGGEVKMTSAGANGKWLALLSPKPVSNDPQILKASGTNEVTVSDVLVGDVWLGTGQSNMDWSVSGADGKEQVEKAPEGSFDGIRLFTVNQVEADEPIDAVASEWKLPTTGNIMPFSATLFFFAEALHQKMPDVPLGLVRSSVGATNLYSWIPNELRDEDPSAEFLRVWWGNATKSWTPEKQAERDQELAAYEAEAARLKAAKQDIPKTLQKPGELIGPKWSRRPSALYNGMIAPLQPFAIRGMIWYQGEWDAKHDWVKIYRGMFKAFATGWRANWAKVAGDAALGRFPIYLVQLPSREPGDGDYWPYMREVQAQLAGDVENSGFVTIFDTNPPEELHPREKVAVGQRLAALALAREYGQPVPWHGPVLKATKVVGSRLMLDFDSGASAIESSDGKPLRNFEIAGADGKYHPASAEFRGNVVALSAPKVPKPATVRYAFVPAPESVNFYNDAGLPAPPFRTDDQPAPTPR